MAPPDIEAGTAPVEGDERAASSWSTRTCCSWAQGPLPEPVVIHVDGRRAWSGIEGAEAGRLREMLARCDDERMTNLAEVSVAFNPSGRCAACRWRPSRRCGTAHIALGNSIAYGGDVDAVAHLDCVMRDATLELDGRPVMVAGVLT